MEGVTLQKYPPRHPMLKHIVKYYWLLSSDKKVVFNNKLFPTNNVDFIINLSSPIKYRDPNSEETFKRAHFSGLRNTCRTIQQEGMLDVVGISFFPAGAFAVLKTPMWEFSNCTVGLTDVLRNIEYAMDLHSQCADNERIEAIEGLLLQALDIGRVSVDLLPHFIDTLYRSGMCIKVNDYCKASGVNQKTLERTFKKQVGVSPKSFIRLTRFQKALEHLVAGNYHNLTSLAYDMGYFDQTHFIKDFQYYMHTSPLVFAKDQNSVKELLAKR